MKASEARQPSGVGVQLALRTMPASASWASAGLASAASVEVGAAADGAGALAILTRDPLPNVLALLGVVLAERGQPDAGV